MEDYIYKNHKKLRCGYTTGSCAAAATQVAVRLLQGEGGISRVEILTPNKTLLSLEVENQQKGEGWASAAIKKDSGDDPDVTNGILVFARAEWSKIPGIHIEGGIGVGRVTKLGLDCPVGSAAINHVPRKMIELEAQTALDEGEALARGLLITISAPEGVELARKTYNPRLGIMGGISILGTSGIVEPMSEKALTDSIRLEMQMLRASGKTDLVITPGNYGEAFAHGWGGSDGKKLDLSSAVKCSNYVGEALDFAAELGFQSALLIGHIGKFVKLAGGVMNTHSRWADCRMEILTAHAALAGASREAVAQLMSCVTTDEAIALLDNLGLRQQVMNSLLEKVDFHLSSRSAGEIETAAILFSNKYGFLGQTPGAEALIQRMKICEEGGNYEGNFLWGGSGTR